MAEGTKIEWTDVSWQPTSGCDRISPGCGGGSVDGKPAPGGGCYAERHAHRLASNPATPQYIGLTRMTKNGPRWTGVTRLNRGELLKPLRWRKHRKIFVDSMGDLFHESISDDDLDHVFATVLACHYLENRQSHTFQVLTKRAERMARYFAAGAAALLRRWSKAGDGRILVGDGDVSFSEEIEGHCQETVRDESRPGGWRITPWVHADKLFPLPNLWLGVSSEDQTRIDERLPHLLSVPAVVRFLSVEPLLAPVTIGLQGVIPKSVVSGYVPVHARLSWVIVGSESGPRARPMDPAWVRSIVRECTATGTACFVKQVVTDAGCAGGNRKGGDPAFWPEDLRVREFPQASP